MLKYLKHSLQAVGEFQSRLILTGFYFTVLPLFSLLARVFGGDALGFGGYKHVSSWVKRPAPEHTLEEARRQY